MDALGFEALLPPEIHSKLLTTFIEPSHPAYVFDDMHDYLYERGFTIYPGKVTERNTFRLSNIGQIYPEDIQSFLNHLEDYLKQTNQFGRLYADAN